MSIDYVIHVYITDTRCSQNIHDSLSRYRVILLFSYLFCKLYLLVDSLVGDVSNVCKYTVRGCNRTVTGFLSAALHSLGYMNLRCYSFLHFPLPLPILYLYLRYSFISKAFPERLTVSNRECVCRVMKCVNRLLSGRTVLSTEQTCVSATNSENARNHLSTRKSFHKDV